MKNNGLFSSLFIDELKDSITLNDAAQGRMATLAQTWHTRNTYDAESLWESFLKQALSYLEFVPPGNPTAPGVYPLYEDYNFNKYISVLYLAPPGSDIDNTSVGSFYPAKLLAQLKERKLNWGILTDGARWRLYSTKSSRPYEDYVELPLAEALEGSDEPEYGLFERFFHKDSFIAEETEGTENGQQDESVGIYKCRLDRDRDQSEQVLEEWVKKPFLAQVDEVLQYICNGFIFDTQKSGEEYTEGERAEIFESAVKLIYRCLFLFYAEARRLLPTDPEKADIYRRHSIQTLCLEARKFRWGQRCDTDQYDLWKHLKGLIGAVNDGDSEYGIMGYNGGLFDDEEERFLGQHQLRNDFLSWALYLLAFIEPCDNEPDEEYAIPYEDLEVRHLGELYETILEYTVQLADSDRIRRRSKKGVEILLVSQTSKKAGDTLIKKGDVYFGESALVRKQTGSYYTPESLVRFLNKKTIVQPLRETFEQEYRQRFNELLEQAGNGHDTSTRRGAAQSAAALVERFVEEQILNFKVCDPAMGSGHFLVDAANQMAELVVALLEEVPHIEGITVSVTSRPNDWRRRITRHCIYGVDFNPLAVNLAKLSLWLNCFASEHKLTFLDHHVRCGNSLISVRSLDQLASIPERKKGGKKRDDQTGDLFPNFKEYAALLGEAGRDTRSISEMNEDDTDEQKAVFDQAQQKLAALIPLADLYTSYLMDGGIRPDDYHALFYSLAKKQKIQNSLNPDLPKILESLDSYQSRHHFFHWPLEFPDVFGMDAMGGFSANIGNPPWNIVKPNSQEFFSDYDPKFRSYKKQEANRVSKKLMAYNPAIAEKWKDYCDRFAEQSAYFKEPLSYSALGKGDINTYKLFLEQFFTVLGDGGRMGIVVPSGIYTDQGCQPLRERFFNRSRVEFLYCFENRWPTVFSAVDGRFKFVTFGTQKSEKTDRFKCAFMEHDPERLPLIDANALKMSVKQVKKFSPDTLSVMEFKNQRDIDITAQIYRGWPLLGEKLEDTWNVKFRSELHMTNDSNLFKTAPTDCPLFEGKMIFLFDSHFESPRYWLDRDEVEEALGENAWEGKHYRVGYRDIAASTNERTLISTVIPKCFHGNKIPTVTTTNDSDEYQGPNDSESLWLTSALCSFVLDFLIRQKISTTLNFFYVYTLPVPRNFGNQIQKSALHAVKARTVRLICVSNEFSELWQTQFDQKWQAPDFWYPPSPTIDTYGPVHEQEIRRRLRDEAKNLRPEWGPHCGVHDRLPDRRDTGDRAPAPCRDRRLRGPPLRPFTG
jgi:Eco57I restriction-modification methylase